MTRLAICGLYVTLCLPVFRATAQEPKPPTPLPSPDERYKADLLVVVAHPDDEAAVTPYVARALDIGKRVAVVYGTRGSSGANEVGDEQAASLGAIREIEARRACATLGISNVWFLPGKDTATQDVLESLANWGHAAALEQLVRLLRLTRAEVILTFLPGTFIGEDHGDHQASGVLATEAFDLAGDPTVFPEQLAVPVRRLEPFLENLRPWQPKKIYYFPDATNEEMFRGKGPEYSVKDISKSKKQPYWRVAVDSFRMHQTQAKNYLDRLSGLSDAELEKRAISDGWGEAQHFILGKSLVGGSVTGDIFERVDAQPIPFAHPQIPPMPPATSPQPAVELAGPWSFYAHFRHAHGLEHLWHPEPPEIALQAGTSLVIPLWLRNPTSTPRELALSVDVPTGWTLQSGAGKFALAANEIAGARVQIGLPALEESAKSKQAPQEVTVRAESNGQSVGVVKLHVELRKTALPQ
jgi:LmbE family N-acetylglucosaminyl deacetylase